MAKTFYFLREEKSNIHWHGRGKRNWRKCNLKLASNNKRDLGQGSEDRYMKGREYVNIFDNKSKYDIDLIERKLDSLEVFGIIVNQEISKNSFSLMFSTFCSLLSPLRSLCKLFFFFNFSNCPPPSQSFGATDIRYICLCTVFLCKTTDRCVINH